MAHMVPMNGPWVPSHPFYKVMERGEIASVLEALQAICAEYGERMMLIEAASVKAAAIVDLENQLGIQFRGVFASPARDTEWYLKPGTVVMVPMTTITEEALEQRVLTQSNLPPHVLDYAANVLKSDALASLPHPERLYPEDAREIKVPDHKTAKPLFRWVENRHPHEVVEDSYFVEGVSKF